MLYEIDIHRKESVEPVDMERVYAELEHSGVSFDKDERRNTIYGTTPTEEQPEYVYVDSADLGRAVQIIASLGYVTDEDDLLDEQQYQTHRKLHYWDDETEEAEKE